MSENQPKVSNRRRFTRINLDVEQGKGGAIQGARLIWKSLDNAISRVFDVSYQGAAVENLTDKMFKVGDRHEVDFEFDGFSVVTIEVEVKWLGGNIVGLFFDKLSVVSRLQFDQFMSDKLIGAHLNMVSKEFYSEDLDCDYWYQGPNETNVYIWQKSDELQKIIIELAEGLIEFSHGKVSLSGAGDDAEVQSHYGDDLDDVELAGLQQITEKALKSKALSVISQLKQHQQAFAPLLAQLNS